MSALRPQGLWAPRGVWRGLWRGRVRLSQKARSRPGILAGTASISSRADRRDPGEGGGGQTAPCGPCSARWPGSPCSAPRAPTPMLIPPPRDSAYCTILKVYKPRSQLPSISPRSSPEAACAHPSGSAETNESEFGVPSPWPALDLFSPSKAFSGHMAQNEAQPSRASGFVSTIHLSSVISHHL
ncbi:placenta-specific protein 9 isoform X2 [Rhinolophus ferrumequinum]|uniref:placenta-specific protein 9 isoform X2 n=1 Tax=Rhinolophus ferrumequinum TaxID=59479 RepID=UPI00140FB3DA|nr:placenta-specific protein 9 isoform X2 [Rhinolophus ferrumequinum]